MKEGQDERVVTDVGGRTAHRGHDERVVTVPVASWRWAEQLPMGRLFAHEPHRDR